jgi:hypothetical protein
MNARTGKVTPRCYAGELRDCDGGPVTKEHYISKALLQRLGSTFIATGLTWAKEPQRTGPNSLVAHVLCKKHNGALGELDSTIVQLYDLVESARQGKAGAISVQGEHVERWGLKVLAGMLWSGNANRVDGIPVRNSAVTTFLAHGMRENYLRVLFDGMELPEGWGLNVFLSPRSSVRNQVEIILNSQPPGHPEEGLIYGITTQLLGFYFATTMTRVTSSAETLWNRPPSVDFFGRAVATFRWRRPTSTPPVQLGTLSSSAAIMADPGESGGP